VSSSVDAVKLGGPSTVNILDNDGTVTSLLRNRIISNLVFQFLLHQYIMIFICSYQAAAFRFLVIMFVESRYNKRHRTKVEIVSVVWTFPLSTGYILLKLNDPGLKSLSVMSNLLRLQNCMSRLGVLHGTQKFYEV
jgi:hypothetical protein